MGRGHAGRAAAAGRRFGLVRLRVADRDYLVALLARRQADDPLVADPRPAQRPRERSAPADPPGRGVGLVVSDDRQRAAVVVLVGELDRGSEPHLAAILLPRRIDDL